jgi:hypothetical protein
MFNDGPILIPVFICEGYAETLTKRWQPHCRTDPLLTPKLHRVFTYPNILDCGPSWCCFYNFCGFWHFQLQSLQSFLFFCQVCILQRGPDHINVPMLLKGYDVRSTSCLNNNAGHKLCSHLCPLTAEFVELFSDSAFFNNGVKMNVRMPDGGLWCRLMHVV